MRTSPLWSTASFGDAADTTPQELDELRAHLAQCSAPDRRWVSLRCAAASLHRIVMTRLVTTATLVVAVVGAVLLAW